MSKIGILVVAYNAESTIESTLKRIPQEFVSEIYSILISDDRSRDLTSARASKFADNSRLPIQVVSQPINLGYGGNQKFGYSWAIKNDWDVVILLHADGQIFMEMGKGAKFIGEDIFFFALCDKAEVPLYCHTGATAPHMKRFSFDEHYYQAFFGKPKEESKLITPKKKIITPR